MIGIRNILFLLILFSISLYAQSVSNIEKFYTLIEKSVQETVPAAAHKESRIYIDFTSPADAAILKNSVIEKTGKLSKVISQKEGADFILTFAVEEARVKYGECFTKSFLGRNYAEREVYLKGFTGLSKPNDNISAGRFEKLIKDTVEFAGMKELGNPSYPFTNPQLPAEPFFSSILEPIIAIGAAVTTVYLLFTVRSK
jgi:hypothetical protein